MSYFSINVHRLLFPIALIQANISVVTAANRPDKFARNSVEIYDTKDIDRHGIHRKRAFLNHPLVRFRSLEKEEILEAQLIGHTKNRDGSVVDVLFFDWKNNQIYAFPHEEIELIYKGQEVSLEETPPLVEVLGQVGPVCVSQSTLNALIQSRNTGSIAEWTTMLRTQDSRESLFRELVDRVSSDQIIDLGIPGQVSNLRNILKKWNVHHRFLDTQDNSPTARAKSIAELMDHLSQGKPAILMDSGTSINRQNFSHSTNMQVPELINGFTPEKNGDANHAVIAMGIIKTPDDKTLLIVGDSASRISQIVLWDLKTLESEITSNRFFILIDGFKSKESNGDAGQVFRQAQPQYDLRASPFYSETNTLVGNDVFVRTEKSDLTEKSLTLGTILSVSPLIVLDKKTGEITPLSGKTIRSPKADFRIRPRPVFLHTVNFKNDRKQVDRLKVIKASLLGIDAPTALIQIKDPSATDAQTSFVSGRIRLIELVPGYTVLEIKDISGSRHLIDPFDTSVKTISVGEFQDAQNILTYTKRTKAVRKFSVSKLWQSAFLYVGVNNRSKIPWPSEIMVSELSRDTRIDVHMYKEIMKMGISVRLQSRGKGIEGKITSVDEAGLSETVTIENSETGQSHRLLLLDISKVRFFSPSALQLIESSTEYLKWYRTKRNATFKSEFD